MNPPGEWIIMNGEYKFVSYDIMAVYGIVRKHGYKQSGAYKWMWEARTDLLSRPLSGDAPSGFSDSLETAKEIVEFLLYKTNTVTPKKEFSDD